MWLKRWHIVLLSFSNILPQMRQLCTEVCPSFISTFEGESGGVSSSFSFSSGDFSSAFSSVLISPSSGVSS
jgi:hypothetical protein